MKNLLIMLFVVMLLPVYALAQENNMRTTVQDYDLFLAVKAGGKFSTDAKAMETAPYGVNGGVEVNFQVNRWFAVMPVIDVTYTSGNNKGINAESTAMGIKPYFLFQPEVKDSGFQPYIGIAPTFTLSAQDVVNNNTAEKCSYIKNHLGIGAAAGFNYIYKNFITGLNFEYNYVLAGSKDDTLLHLDLSSGFTVGVRFGYRF